jgi:alpha-L-fucosidase 2
MLKMKSLRQTTFALIALGLLAGVASASDLKLWYAKPAEKWDQALPVGSGRLGAMVFGGTAQERIQYNEDTLWTGKPHDYVHEGAVDALPEIRKLVAEGTKDSVKAAEDLIRAKFLSIPLRQRAYQPFGDLNFQFPGHDKATDYRRELDLDAAVARVSYTVDGVRYERQVIASYPDNVIAVRLTADKPGKISFTLKQSTPHKVSQVKAIGSDVISLTGQVQDPKRFMYFQTGKDAPKPNPGDPPEPVQTDGLKFESRARVTAEGGKVSASGDASTVESADSATVVLVAATTFKNFQDITGDPAARCEEMLGKAGGKSFDVLLAAHTKDHQNLFRRVSMNLGDNSERSKLPTDERLKLLKTDGVQRDPGLAVLHFQFGRYCLIASSRPGTQAANLQGVWNELLDPPWESKYTTNINFEMNYWPAEVTNLSECHEPFFDLTADCAVSGAKVAKAHYGAGGWVLHHNTDLWRGTAGINNIDGQWPTGGAWLCHHLWEHYQFTGDRAFLEKRAYPLMKSASQFFLDFLVKHERTGWLISTPSHSPEQGGTVEGPAMDQQLIRALFDYTIESAKILGTDSEFAAKVAEARKQLAPDQVGEHGQLQEWLTDIDQPNNNHRHMSPLWCLYPGTQYTAFDADPKLYNAAKVLLKWRGDGSTGWSFAWRMPLWARAGDGDMALAQYNGLLGKRTLPNLFDLCGPFQIDGNFGATAGVAEMLLQSHQRLTEGDRASYVIHLLPALPKAWPDGEVKGLCARGGFEVDVKWAGGAVQRAVVRSKLGGHCKVRAGERLIDLDTQPGKEYVLDGQLAVANAGGK